MSFTLDFILFFVLIIIPGLIFKRFYFWGEFSKQFSTKGSVYKSAFYSIIPGILIQIIGLWLYTLTEKYTFSIENVIDVFSDITTENTEDYKPYTKGFLENDFFPFVKHELWIFALASGLGITLYLFVRNFRLDCKSKLFRFDNQWFYIFSGEINRFQKFQNAKNRFPIVDNINSNKSKRYLPPYVDLLIDSSNGERIMYSGYVVDYDLGSENSNQLDKIYLQRASRFRKIREGENLKDKEVFGSRVKIPIEGKFFMVKADQIINMNIDYEPIEKTTKEWTVKEKRYRKIHKAMGWIFIFIILYFSFINIPIIENIFPKVTDYFEGYNVFSRLFAAFILMLFLVIFMPDQINKKKPKDKIEANEDEEKFGYTWSGIKVKAITFIIVGGIYYLIYY
jgi:hypothetical protein